jgi:uncharacterized protein
MNIKAFSTKFEAIGEGKIEGRASVFDLLDSQGDIVRRGAFTADLSARGNVRPILADHDPTRSVGLGRFVEKSDGLHVSIELAMELPDARDTFVRVTKGIATGLSIGYLTVRDKIAQGARELLELQLWETSVCVFPALAAAQITSAKHNPQQLEALLGSLRSLRTLNGYEELLAGLKSARAGALTGTAAGVELRTGLRSLRTRVRR